MAKLDFEKEKRLRDMVTLRIRDLNSGVNGKLPILINEKTIEIVDESLVEYVMVLINNGHNLQKVASELNDFVPQGQAGPFTSWLFSTIDEITRPSNPTSITDLEQNKKFKSVEISNNPLSSSLVQNNDSGHQSSRMTTSDAGMYRGRSRSPARTRSLKNGTEHYLNRQTDRFSTERRSGNGLRNKTRRENDITDLRQVLERSDRKYVLESLDTNQLRSKNISKSSSQVDLRGSSSTSRFQKHHSDDDDDDRKRVYKNEKSSEKIHKTSLVRCAKWPNCDLSDSKCPMHHPKEPCKYFPNCSRPLTCIYVHPSLPCRFKGQCTNEHCNYQHDMAESISNSDKNFVMASSEDQKTNLQVQRPSTSTVPCRFYPNCKNQESCPFLHPIAFECRYGASCLRPGCIFSHPPSRVIPGRSLVNIPCRFGRLCAKADCSFQHPISNESKHLNHIETSSSNLDGASAQEIDQNFDAMVDNPTDQIMMDATPFS